MTASFISTSCCTDACTELTVTTSLCQIHRFGYNKVAGLMWQINILKKGCYHPATKKNLTPDWILERIDALRPVAGHHLSK
jgi:hypothetical protein